MWIYVCKAGEYYAKRLQLTLEDMKYILLNKDRM